MQVQVIGAEELSWKLTHHLWHLPKERRRRLGDGSFVWVEGFIDVVAPHQLFQMTFGRLLAIVDGFSPTAHTPFLFHFFGRK